MDLQTDSIPYNPVTHTWLEVMLDHATITIILMSTCIVHQGCHASLRNAARVLGDGDGAPAADAPVRLTWRHAVAFPCVASLGLLFVYMFFDRIQFLYIIMITIVVGIALEM